MTDTDLRNRRVLIREDLNVPVQAGVVTSDARIRAALATIRYALDQHARVFILSHLGRPKEGQDDPALTLAPVAARLSELLGKPVPLRKDWIAGVDCAAGSAVLCENVRFLKGEKQDDEQLARRMAASLGVPDKLVFDILAERERLGTTGLGAGIAIPHGKLPGLDRIVGLFARLERPIEFDSIDGIPVDLIFVLLAPEQAGADHLKALAAVSRLLRNREVCAKLRGTDSPEALYALLTEHAAPTMS